MASHFTRESGVVCKFAPNMLQQSVQYVNGYSNFLYYFVRNTKIWNFSFKTCLQSVKFQILKVILIHSTLMKSEKTPKSIGFIRLEAGCSTIKFVRTLNNLLVVVYLSF